MNPNCSRKKTTQIMPSYAYVNVQSVYDDVALDLDQGDGQGLPLPPLHRDQNSQGAVLKKNSRYLRAFNRFNV